MQNILPFLVVSLGIVCVALSIAVYGLYRQVRRTNTAWADLLQGADGARIERLVLDQMDRMQLFESRLGESNDRIHALEAKMLQSKRFVGLVRYDAFGDIGGEQSFSFALYDDDGNGAVITSQVGREACRVFGKQLIAGRAEGSLSAEEQQAIELAAASKNRPRIGK